MRRREFVTLVGVAAGGARAAARTVGDRVSQQRVTRRLCTNGCRASQPLYLPRPQPGGLGVCTGPRLRKTHKNKITMISKGRYLIPNCEDKGYYLSSHTNQNGFYHDRSDSRKQHTNYRKLHSQTPLPNRARGRAADRCCPRAQSTRPSRCYHDPGRLSSWATSKRGLQPRVASDRARPRQTARPPCQARHAKRPSRSW
jgi:hypothetical protein